jgi:hypothetical protein
MNDQPSTSYAVTVEGAIGPAVLASLGDVRVARTSRSTHFRLRCHSGHDFTDVAEWLGQQGLSVISIHHVQGPERPDPDTESPHMLPS